MQLLGSVAVTGDAGLLVFELAETNRLSVAVKDGEILLLSLAISDRRGVEAVRLVDGHVRLAEGSEIEYQHVPGHHLVTAPFHARFLPSWALRQVQANEPSYRPDDQLTLLRLEVVEPGLQVQVQGLWLEQFHGTVITERGLHFVSCELVASVPLRL